MARPTNAAALQGHIQGLREAKAAFAKMPEIMRTHLNDATFVTISEIVRQAKANLYAKPSIRTGTLVAAVGFVMNWKNGRGRAGIQNITTRISNPNLGTVGRSTVKIRGALVTSRGGRVQLIQPRRYAHLVEFGTRHSPAEPFMLPAAASQRQLYLDRCRKAGLKAEADLATIGGRFV